MLDSKIKDYDASIELLEDRKKQAKWLFIIFYVVGLSSVISFGLIAPISWMTAELLAFAGLSFLFVSGLIYFVCLQYNFYLFLIKKGIIDAKKGREI